MRAAGRRGGSTEPDEQSARMPFLTLSALRTRPHGWIGTFSLLAWVQLLLCFEGVLRDNALEQGGLIHDPFFWSSTLCAGAVLLAIAAANGRLRLGASPSAPFGSERKDRTLLIATCVVGGASSACAALLSSLYPQVSSAIPYALGAVAGIAFGLLSMLWGVSLSLLDLREVLVLVTFGACLQWIPLAFVQWMSPAIKASLVVVLPALFAWSCLRLDREEAAVPEERQAETSRASSTGSAGKKSILRDPMALRLGAAMLIFSMVVQFVWGFFVKLVPSRLDVGLFGPLFGLVTIASTLVGCICIGVMNYRHCYRLELFYRAMFLLCTAGCTSIGIATAQDVTSGLMLSAYLIVYVGYSLLYPTMLLLALGYVHMRRVHARGIMGLVLGAHYLGLFAGAAVLNALAQGRAPGDGVDLVPYVVTVTIVAITCAYVIVFPERDLLSLSPLLFGMSHESVDLRCERLGDEAGLTPREGEVLALLARGRDVVYIADRLGIARNTVNVHRRNVYAKLGIHSQQELLSMVENAREPGAPE